jgi:hypothetical protein
VSRRYQPFQLGVSPAHPAHAELVKLSERGALDAAKLFSNNPGYLQRVFGAGNEAFSGLPAEARLRILRDNWVVPQSTPEGEPLPPPPPSQQQQQQQQQQQLQQQPYFKPEARDVCEWIALQALQDPSHHGRVAAELVRMAAAVLGVVDRDVFWEHLATAIPSPAAPPHRTYEAQPPKPVVVTATGHRGALQHALALSARVLDSFTGGGAAMIRSPSRAFAHQLLAAWWAAHQRHLPAVGPHLRDLGLRAGAAAGMGLWTTWHKSLQAPFERMFVVSVQYHRCVRA